MLTHLLPQISCLPLLRKPFNGLYTIKQLQSPVSTKQLHHQPWVKAFNRSGARCCFHPFHREFFIFQGPIYECLSWGFKPFTTYMFANCSSFFCVCFFSIRLFIYQYICSKISLIKLKAPPNYFLTFPPNCQLFKTWISIQNIFLSWLSIENIFFWHYRNNQFYS